MPPTRRSTGQILVHGFYGAFLAALFAFPVRMWWIEFSWFFVGILVVLGFVLGALFAEDFIDFLERWLWWW